ncbi:site-specific integrase [Ornithobacterium rhinotracheale]|uniref:site-specific integrase n=1 Tax=Ornithobacterium rhinotracheale TaxID=28251 RepID=UPI00129CD130|nr:site-specific integrase [Ornithobacterium rhinotracheale]MRJ09062.1 site-specific integrase [Ornithobacterium rhinotracheale]UOH77834.1 site-specific integrase [Ornithobacterium rhinotracheale]
MKYHAQFLLDKEKDKPDAKLRYRIKWDGNIVAFNVGYRIDIEKWSKETQRCKANTTHGKKKIPANVINRKIQRFETACEDVFTKFKTLKKTPEKEQFKELFNKEIGRKTKEETIEKELFEAFDEFLEEESTINQWTSSTKRKMKVVKSHLLEFDESANFKDFNEEKLTNYLIFLQRNRKLRNSTTTKHIAWLKRFFKWATKKGYNDNNDFQNFAPKFKNTQKKIIFLTPTEFKKFREFKIPNTKQYLERVRDVFLFQCFTGLRYSDVYNLKKTDVKNGFIEITTIKTADSLHIELNEHSRKILEKYKDYPTEKGKALPVITNQRMNEYLKELAELAEIDEPVKETYYIGNNRFEEIQPKYALLGTHAGRRTFICNALSLGIPPQVVMKWTGHSDYKAMKPYIDIADEVKASAMEKFNEL